MLHRIFVGLFKEIIFSSRDGAESVYGVFFFISVFEDDANIKCM